MLIKPKSSNTAGKGFLELYKKSMGIINQTELLLTPYKLQSTNFKCLRNKVLIYSLSADNGLVRLTRKADICSSSRDFFDTSRTLASVTFSYPLSIMTL